MYTGYMRGYLTMNVWKDDHISLAVNPRKEARLVREKSVGNMDLE